MALRGSREFRARLKAVSLVFKPLGKTWADETVKLMRPQVPFVMGRLRKSIRRKNSTQKRATVVAHFSAFFIDKGTKAHAIRPKRAKMLRWVDENRRTVFARAVNHRGFRGRPFRDRAAKEALRRKPMSDELIRVWNEAA